MAVAIRAITRIVDADDAPTLGAGQNGYALTWDNATGKFVATAMFTGGLLATGATTGATSQAQTFTNGISLAGDFETTERITLLTTGALKAAPWVIDQMQVDPLKHDNVFMVNYNCKRVSGTNTRVVDGEHCILFNIESRFHPTDPVAHRGQLEWYLRIDPALTGTPNFNKMPFSMAYNFDSSNSQFQFGDSADASNSFLFYGGMGGYVALFGAPLYIRGTTSTDRLTLSMSSSGDSGQISSYDELAGSYLRLGLNAGGYIMSNVLTVGGEAYHRWDVNTNRIAVLTATGLGLFTTFPSSALDMDAGAITMKEMTAPSEPAANSVRLYAVDDGAGKTKLMALFHTGAAQQIAIEV